MIYIVFFLFVVSLVAVIMLYPTSPKPQTTETPEKLYTPITQHLIPIEWHTKEQDIDIVAIGMEKRYESHFLPLKKVLSHYGYDCQWFKGINGKRLDYNTLPLTDRYKHFFVKNEKDRQKDKDAKDFRGHLGCTLSHLSVIHNMKKPTIILEDDVDIQLHLDKQLPKTVEALHDLDPEWDILLLGWCCLYTDSAHCVKHDREAIRKGGLVKMHYWIGGWAYMIRSVEVAQKIIKHFSPIFSHIDLGLADLVEEGKLNVYGCIPTLINHPGNMRLSSFDYTQRGDIQRLRSDTNH